jgi:hypothetical protein
VRRALAFTSIAVVLAVAGCGSDNSGETTAPTVSIPAITSPIPATTTVPTTTSTPTGTTGNGTGNGNGGVGPSGKPNPNQPDSETNDVPPPAGSPQDAFEKQCQQNPQACG